MRFLSVVRCGIGLFLTLPGVVCIHLGGGEQRASLEAIRATAFESYRLLRELHQGKTFPLWNVSRAVSGVSSYLTQAAKLDASGSNNASSDSSSSSGLPARVKPFLILSQHRSGSAYMCSMLDSHPDLICALGEPYGAGTSSGAEEFYGSLKEAFELSMKKVLEKLQDDVVPWNVKWFGIKVQSNQVWGINGGLANTDAMVIFHFRRNVLRQIISGLASTRSHGILNALMAKAFKPFIGSSIRNAIAAKLKERQDTIELVAKAGANVCTTSHYEDWLNPATLPVIEKKIFDCFGVQPMQLAAATTAVHAYVSVLSSVANPRDVVKALTGTPFEYMLEKGSPAEVFENLKKTDEYEIELQNVSDLQNLSDSVLTDVS